MSSQPFFQELQKIINSQPKYPLVIANCEGCEYCNEVYDSKNLIYCFDTYRSTNSFYTFDSVVVDNCGDCDYAVESQSCYESVDFITCFNCIYLEYCGNLQDSSYCTNCSNGHDLFGCVNLRNKSFCIFNRQFSEEEYHEKVKEFKKLPSEKILKVVEELKDRYPVTQTHADQNENSDYGNHMHNNKDCYACFDASYDESCGYLYDSFHCKMSYDLTYTSLETQLTYQAVDSVTLFNCSYMMHTKNCQDSAYIFNCSGLKNCLGCVGLQNKEYCILNRQLTKEEYEKIAPKILNQLKEDNLGWADLRY